MNPHRNVRALVRGLELLRLLNSAGNASIQQLSAASGIHRTTIYRLLNTMREAGYVSVNEADGTFRPTSLVRLLSGGFHDDTWIREAAYPALAALTRKILWPTNMLTPHGDIMVCSESTHHLSPFSVHRAIVGTRYPFPTTSFGKAYLAFCTEEERKALLDLLARSAEPANRVATDSRLIARIIRQTRKDGYGSAIDAIVKGISSIALPVRVADRTIGCVNIAFFTSALTPVEAAAKYLADLKICGSEVEARASAP